MRSAEACPHSQAARSLSVLHRRAAAWHHRACSGPAGYPRQMRQHGISNDGNTRRDDESHTIERATNVAEGRCRETFYQAMQEDEKIKLSFVRHGCPPHAQGCRVGRFGGRHKFGEGEGDERRYLIGRVFTQWGCMRRHPSLSHHRGAASIIKRVHARGLLREIDRDVRGATSQAEVSSGRDLFRSYISAG